MASKALGRDVRYALYLPPGYHASAVRYPVVYLLHGYGEDETGWLRSGHLDELADELIARRSIPPMVLVMPEGGTSFYVNNHDGSVRYEDFFLREFIPTIDSRYRVLADRTGRAVAGISMGGFGALRYGLGSPHLFRACVALSSSILTDQELIAESDARWERILAGVYGPGLKGDARITALWKACSPLHLLRSNLPDLLQDLRLYLDCGDDDLFSRGNALFHLLLRDLGLAHDYRVRDGGHTWSCLLYTSRCV